MNQDLVNWLITHYGQEVMKPGLERIKEALAPLLPTLQSRKIITIAGTNGKGETTLYLSRYLKNSTHCTWISPHIERITERFVSEEGEISLPKLQELILFCHEKLLNQKIKLSFYEFLFYVFCHWARERNPTYLLLEVGLGGRLDAVNVFDTDLLLLPSISRDHQEYLGSRYDLILKEKLGLLRNKTHLISFLSLKYLRERSQELAKGIGAKHTDLNTLKKIDPSFFSERNQLLAYAAYLALKNEKMDFSLWKPETYVLEHRGEIWNKEGEMVFFGSHNVDGVRKLIQFLHSGNYTFNRPPFDLVLVAFSQRSELDLKVMLKMLKASGLGRVVVTTFNHPKAAKLDLIKRLSSQEGLEFAQDYLSSVQGKSDKRVLVTGSYYFIGDFQAHFRRYD